MVVVAGGGFEAAARGGGVGGGGAGVGPACRVGGVAREAGFLGGGGGGGRGGRGPAGAREQVLALAAARGGHPGALDVRVTLEAAAVAARAAPVVRAPLLGLVAAVVAGRAAAGPRAGVRPAAAAAVHDGQDLLPRGRSLRRRRRGRCGRRRRLRLLLPELDGGPRRGRLVGVERALRGGDEREHGVVGRRPLVGRRDEDHPDVTGRRGGVYRRPVPERGGGGGGLVARRRGARPELGRERGAGTAPPGAAAGIEAEREVAPAAGGRQPLGDRGGVRRRPEAPPGRRQACSRSRIAGQLGAGGEASSFGSYRARKRKSTRCSLYQRLLPPSLSLLSLYKGESHLSSVEHSSKDLEPRVYALGPMASPSSTQLRNCTTFSFLFPLTFPLRSGRERERGGKGTKD